MPIPVQFDPVKLNVGLHSQVNSELSNPLRTQTSLTLEHGPERHGSGTIKNEF